MAFDKYMDEGQQLGSQHLDFNNSSESLNDPADVQMFEEKDEN